MDESLRSLLLQKLNTWERNLVEVVMNQYQIKLDKVQAKIDELVVTLWDFETTPKVVLTDTEQIIAFAAMRLRAARDAIDGNDTERSLDELLYVAEMIGLATVDKEAAIKKARTKLAKKAADAAHVENRGMKAQGLAWYAEHKGKFANKDDAARAMLEIVPVAFSTARKWLRGQ